MTDAPRDTGASYLMLGAEKSALAQSLSVEEQRLASCGHLRRLVTACEVRGQHSSAAWYANKLVTLSQLLASAQETSPSGPTNAMRQFAADVLALARCYFNNAEYQRAFRTLEIHGLLDLDKNACAHVHRQAALAAATSGITADGLDTPTSAMKPDSLAAYLLAAQALKASRQFDKAVLLLESCMEGRGLPPIRVPLRPRDDNAEDASASRLDQDGGPRSSAANPFTAAGADCDTKQQATSQSDGIVTWRLVKLMAHYHSSRSSRYAAADAATDPSIAKASPVFAVSVSPIPLSDGSDVNLIAAMCELRGECLLMCNNRPRATEWFVAAIRCDAYSVGALHALIDNHLLADEEETRLARYYDAIFDIPVFTDVGGQPEIPTPAGRDDVISKTRQRSASSSTAGSVESARSTQSALPLASPPRILDTRRQAEGVGLGGSKPKSSAAATKNLLKTSSFASPPRAPATRTTSSGSTAATQGLRRNQSFRGASKSNVVPGDTVAPSGLEETENLENIAVRGLQLDLQWLKALVQMRLNRYSVVVPLASKFQMLERDYMLGGNYDVLSAKCEGLHYQHDAAASHALSRRLMAYDPLDRRTACLHYANLVELGKSSELFQLGHAAVKIAPKGS
jgi:tetratricopeptide (TPR) repeat protein